MKLHLRGKFRVEGPAGEDLTPIGHKDKAVLAMLALTEGHVCSRMLLQDTLWTGRFPHQAAASLRRSLYLIRQAFGDSKERIISDRSTLRLSGPVDLVWGEPGQGPLLGDIRVKEKPFQKLLNQIRYRRDGAIPDKVATQRAEERIVIVCNSISGDPELRFVTRNFVAMLAQHLRQHGPVAITMQEGGQAETGPSENVLWRIEIDSMRTATQWITNLSVFRVRPQRFVWSGRLRLPFNVDTIVSDMRLVDFAGRTVASIQSGGRQSSGTYENLLTATHKIFLGRRDELELADKILAGLEPEDLYGTVPAWRAFVGLTRQLEHGISGSGETERALELAALAEQRGQGNALAKALAAQVTLKVGQDNERAEFLAQRARQFEELNPYALHALSQAKVSRGDYLAGYRLAMLARKGSQSLPNSFCWDMQACLAALGVGQRREALDLASQANLKTPSYRPALRYMIALNFLRGCADEARRWSSNLRALEPDFHENRLLDDDYPVDTLRSIGLQDELQSMDIIDPWP